MAEITRVPLQPIRKGSLAKLWLGVIVVVGLAAALAWFTVPKGVSVTELQAGVGGSPSADDVVFVKYVGKLADGTVFDEGRDYDGFPIPGIMPEGFPFLASGVVPGLTEALLQMQKGGKYEVFIPAEKGYGADPQPGSKIPANADLIFEIELVDFMTQEDANRRVQVMQQMMQAPQGQAGEGGREGQEAGQAGQ